MQVRLPPAINDVVQRHTKWLKRKLYDQRERNGDIAFVFLPAGDAEAEADIDIPVPEHALADRPAAANDSAQNAAASDLEMRDENEGEQPKKIKCHR